MSDHESVVVDELPSCDLCTDGTLASYDASTRQSTSWAYLCEAHFATHGRGLGLGVGQRLILRSSVAGEAIERAGEQ